MTIADLLGCASATNTREKDDLFETESEATLALLQAENSRIPGDIWEPFSGKGAIARVLIDKGYNVTETDLVDRGRSQSRIDFLMERKPLAPAILSNPPFKLASQIIWHALHELRIEYLALLLKGDFLHTLSRYEMVQRVGMPSRIYGLTWRPDFTGEGAPPMTCSWYVWDEPNHGDYSPFRLLLRP